MTDKKSKILLIVLSSLLVIILGIIAFILINNHMVESQYTTSISKAEEYLQGKNYEDAIVAYKEALEIDPDSEAAYLGLADTYVAMGDTTNAVNILNKGLARIDSSRIRNALNRLGNTETEMKDLVAVNSDKIAFDTSFEQKIVTYTFEDFKEEFGSVQSASTDSDGYLEVVHKDLNAVCYYKNTSDNKKIVDTSKKLPYNFAMPEKIQLKSLLLIFRNWEGYVSRDKLELLVGKKLKAVKEDGRYVVEFDCGDYTMKVETDKDGKITSENAWNELSLKNANQEEKGSTVTGVVTNAVTGDGVANATVIFTLQNGDGTEITTTTNSSGAFEIELDPGKYEITIEAENFEEEEFVLEVQEGRNYSGEQLTISPELEEGTARIVLEWGAEPVDLDSYLIGTSGSGESVNIRFSNKIAKSGDTVFAELDLDDTSGYGPETTTIYDLSGTYKFRVLDYRRTGTMAAKGATVKVYLPGEPVTTITLDSSSGVEDAWDVCEINQGKLTILNKAADVKWRRGTK